MTRERQTQVVRDDTYLLGQDLDTDALLGVSPEVNLGQHLVGERVTHDEARVAVSTTQVH